MIYSENVSDIFCCYVRLLKFTTVYANFHHPQKKKEYNNFLHSAGCLIIQFLYVFFTLHTYVCMNIHSKAPQKKYVLYYSRKSKREGSLAGKKTERMRKILTIFNITHTNCF